MTTGRKVLIGVAAAVVLGGLIVGNILKNKGKATEVQAEPAKLQTLVSKVRAPGTIQAERTVKISATTMGQVSRLAVKEGDRVTQGQFLLSLDDEQLRASLNEAQASVASSEARLRLSEASLQQAEATFKRNQSLAKSSLVSPQELENSETQMRTARADRDANREFVHQAREAVRRAKDQLSKTVFNAPISGTVTELNVEVGEMAVIGTMNNPGTVLMTISDMSQMEIWADVDEADIVNVRNGQEVKITIDALPDTSFHGVVRDIAASGSNQAALGTEAKTNFTVKISLTDHVAQIKPGMSGDVEITTATKAGALTVPIQSVVARKPADLEARAKGRRDRKAQADEAPAGKPAKDRTGVFVVGADGKVTFHDVRTGLLGDTDFEIVGDVKKGDKVVTGPYKTLRTLKIGTKVKVVSAISDKGGKKS